MALLVEGEEEQVLPIVVGGRRVRGQGSWFVYKIRS